MSAMKNSKRRGIAGFAAMVAAAWMTTGQGDAQAQALPPAQPAGQPAGPPAQSTASEALPDPAPPAAPADAPSPTEAGGGADLDAAVDEAEVLGEAAEAEAITVPEGDKLRTPDSPAFAILGVSPTSIQNPTTPRDLAVALSGFLKDGSLLVPESLAVEVAPFWLISHDRLTYADYAAADVGQLWRNFSASLGTTGVAEDGSRSLAVGARTQLAFDSAAGACRKYEEKLQAIATLGALNLSTEAMLTLRAEHSPDGVFDAKTFNAALLALKKGREQAVAEALEKLATVRDECAKAATARPRVLSLAAAVAWRYAGSKLENSDFVSQSYWATYAQRLGTWSVLAMSRLQFDEADRGWDGFVDLGARAIVPRRTYAGSLEVILRRQAFGDDAGDADLQLRVGLQVEYMIREGTLLSVAFGKGFAAVDAGELFSLASLSASFGDPKIAR
jgi:hypothetical protein